MLNLPGLNRWGPALYRPWLDRRADRLLAELYFPLSCAWAAALEAGTSLDRFRQLISFQRQPPLLERALHRIAGLDHRYRVAEREWERAFFGEGEADLQATVRRRNLAAMSFMAGRAHLVPLRAMNRLPAVRWEIASHAEVEAAHGDRLASPERAFCLPERLPQVHESRSVRTAQGAEFWLRFPSPVQPTGDVAWAHVFEPPSLEQPPTLIFLHGIGVEPEFTPFPADAITRLVERGVRVVVLEGLWHGRRRPSGSFGGERVLARAPLGFLDYFHTAALEAAVLVGWARARSRSVGVGGYSLGSMATGLIAEVAAAWPPEARPDAALLIAHGADPPRVALEGSLMRRIGFDAALARGGWDLPRFEQWRALVGPTGEPAVDPRRIVAVLGEADELTRCGPALDQMRRWRVPESNVFLCRRGHYTIAPALAFDRAPLARFVDLLNQRPETDAR